MYITTKDKTKENPYRAACEIQAGILMPPVSAVAFHLEFSKLQLCLPSTSGWQTLFLYGFLHTTFWKEGNKSASWSTVSVTDSQDTQPVYSFQSTPGLGRASTLYQWTGAHIWSIALKNASTLVVLCSSYRTFRINFKDWNRIWHIIQFSKCLLNSNPGYWEKFKGKVSSIIMIYFWLSSS